MTGPPADCKLKNANFELQIRGSNKTERSSLSGKRLPRAGVIPFRVPAQIGETLAATAGLPRVIPRVRSLE